MKECLRLSLPRKESIVRVYCRKQQGFGLAGAGSLWSWTLQNTLLADHNPRSIYTIIYTSHLTGPLWTVYWDDLSSEPFLEAKLSQAKG